MAKTFVYYRYFGDGPLTIGVEGLGTFPAKKLTKGWAIDFESEEEARGFIGSTGSPLYSLEPFDPPAPRVEDPAPTDPVSITTNSPEDNSHGAGA